MFRVAVVLGVLFVLPLLCPLPAHAETIIFKDGSKLTGKVIEQTEEKVVIDLYGTPVPYAPEEIERIEPDASPAQPAPKKPAPPPTAPQAPAPTTPQASVDSPQAFYEEFRKAMIAAEGWGDVKEFLAQEVAEMWTDPHYGMDNLFTATQKIVAAQNYKITDVQTKGNETTLVRDISEGGQTFQTDVILRKEEGQWKFANEILRF